MNELQVYDFEDHAVRTVMRGGEPWFVAADVCRVLGDVDTSVSVRGQERKRDDGTSYRSGGLEPDEWDTHTVSTPSGEQQMLLISEPGLYALIFKFRNPDSNRFKRWLFHEVIPSIRKTGVYAKNVDPILALLDSAREVRVAQIELEQRQMVLEAHVDEVEETVGDLGEGVAKAVALAESVEASYIGRTGFKTCLGFARMHGMKVEKKYLAVIGRTISKYCRDHGLHMHSVQDERYDSVKSYPIEVLERHIDLFRRYAY